MKLFNKMAKMTGLGKGLDALFPSNVDINTLGGDVSHEASEKIIEMKIKIKRLDFSKKSEYKCKSRLNCKTFKNYLNGYMVEFKGVNASSISS